MSTTSGKPTRSAGAVRTALAETFCERLRATADRARQQGAELESVRLTESAAVELGAGMAALAVQCLEAFVEPRFMAAVAERPSITERWPLGVGAHPSPEVVSALKEVRRAVGEALEAPGAEPGVKWPAAAAPLDVAEWAARLQPGVGEELQRAAAEDRMPPSVRVSLDGRTSDLATYLLALVYLAAREVDEDRARPTVRIGANKYARATVQLMSIGPDLLRRDEQRGLAKVETEADGEPRLAIMWRGGTQPVQLAIEWRDDLAAAALRGILTNLHEDGLRDWLLLHRMNAEQASAPAFTWTFAEHCERSVYARRIAQRNITEAQVQKAVSERLRLLHRAELRYEQVVPWKGTTATKWVRIGKHGLIDIPMGVDTFNGAEAARISILAELKGGTSGKKGEKGRSFALVSEGSLMLSGGELRLAAVLACERTYAAEESGGVLVRRARYLWETATLRGGEPAPKKRAEAADALERQLDKLGHIGEFGNWRRLDEGEVTPETRYEIRPPQWWRDQVVHRLPPVLRPTTANLPRTGLELKAWREGRGLSLREAAQALGVGHEALRRAEAGGAAPLGDFVRRKLLAGRSE